MIFSENRFPLFGIMRYLPAHDFLRKPVPTFRNHALGADALDRSATAGELILEPLEPAVEVVHAVDNGLSLSCEGRDYQRYRGTQIGRHHRRAIQAVNA